MEFWYVLIENVLPFAWTNHNFMKNALLAIILLSFTFGLMSTMIVNNKMAFFADSIGHSAFTGIGLGVLLGLKSPVWAMMIFAIVFSVFIVALKRQNNLSTDTIIGVFSATAVSLGLVIMSKGGGFNKYSYLLTGDLLSVSAFDISLVLVSLVLVIIYWSFMFNKLLLLSINSSVAKSRGINVFLYEILFTAVTAVVISISIKWVGLLIINSLLILPGASARNISSNMRRYHILSVGIALVSGMFGLIFSYYLGTSAGATITLTCSAIYFLTLGARQLLNI